MVVFQKTRFFKTIVFQNDRFIKFVVSLTIVNDNPSITIVKDEPSLTIVNDDPLLMIVNDNPSLTIVNEERNLPEGHLYLSLSISRSFNSPTTVKLHVRRHSIKLHVIFSKNNRFDKVRRFVNDR